MFANFLVYRNLRRTFGEAEREQWEAVPEEFRPPRSGKWLLDARRTVALADAADRQGLLHNVFDAFSEEGWTEDTVLAWTWLEVRPDEAGRERMAVMVGSHLLGVVAEDGGKKVRKQIRRQARKDAVVWVSTWVERDQDGRYVAAVGLS
ncbi:MAG TPA: hypothetical protein VH063_03265 [Gaiellaceae bacterium]|jgi:hypothetical protein|nr:hypothetical protein [Gaiellaceae bacterium]